MCLTDNPVAGCDTLTEAETFGYQPSHNLTPAVSAPAAGGVQVVVTYNGQATAPHTTAPPATLPKT